MVKIISVLLARDLNKLQAEIEQYKQEEIIWHTEKSIANSAGNLCLHLTGNLNTYIGAVLGNTGYVRNRELEFSQKNISRQQLLKMLQDTSNMVQDTLSNLTEQDIKNEYPLLVLEKKTTTEYFLVHLALHLSYHLGQVNYHRRLLDV